MCCFHFTNSLPSPTVFGIFWILLVLVVVVVVVVVGGAAAVAAAVVGGGGGVQPRFPSL